MSAEVIYKDNPYDLDCTVTKRDANTGKFVAATGIVDLHGWIAATPEGAAINPALDLVLTERGGVPGTYHGIITAAVINAQLFGSPSFDGKTVYLVYHNADVDVVIATKVRAVRKIT